MRMLVLDQMWVHLVMLFEMNKQTNSGVSRRKLLNLASRPSMLSLVPDLEWNSFVSLFNSFSFPNMFCILFRVHPFWL